MESLAILAQAAERSTDTILWIIAAVLVIAGIVAIIRAQVLWGIVLIVLGLLVGPGGVRVFDLDSHPPHGRGAPPDPGGPRHISEGDRGDLNPQPPGPQPGALTD